MRHYYILFIKCSPQSIFSFGCRVLLVIASVYWKIDLDPGPPSISIIYQKHKNVTYKIQRSNVFATFQYFVMFH